MRNVRLGRRQRLVDWLGHVGQVLSDLVPYSGSCSARPFEYRLSSDTVPRFGRCSSMPWSRDASLIVVTALSVRGKLMKGASWYTASRTLIGWTPTLSAAAVWDFSCGNARRQARTVAVISYRVRSLSASGLEDISEPARIPSAPDRCRAHRCRAVQTAGRRWPRREPGVRTYPSWSRRESYNHLLVPRDRPVRCARAASTGPIMTSSV